MYAVRLHRELFLCNWQICGEFVGAILRVEDSQLGVVAVGQYGIGLLGVQRNDTDTERVGCKATEST